MVLNSTEALPRPTLHSLDNVKTMPAAIAIAAVLAFLILRLFAPRLDPREPPLLKPRVPFLGHILGMIRYQAQYHVNLQRTTHQPIATLPMLTGKMYAVWDPYLVASGLRSKSLSTTAHTIAATPALAQISPATVALLRGPNGAPLVEHMMFHTIPTALKPPHINPLTTAALSNLASALTTRALTPNRLFSYKKSSIANILPSLRHPNNPHPQHLAPPPAPPHLSHNNSPLRPALPKPLLPPRNLLRPLDLRSKPPPAGAQPPPRLRRLRGPPRKAGPL